MKDNRCFVCKYREDFKPKSSDDIIFDEKGNSLKLPLCYGHSVELFKTGQKTFLKKHNDVFDAKSGAHDDLEVLTDYSAQRDRMWF